MSTNSFLNFKTSKIPSLRRLLKKNGNQIPLIHYELEENVKFISFTIMKGMFAGQFTINSSTQLHALHTCLFAILIPSCFCYLNPTSMAPFLKSLLILFATFLSIINLGKAATCSECFIHSRAAYYPNSDDKGTESKISNYKYMPHRYMYVQVDII